MSDPTPPVPPVYEAYRPIEVFVVEERSRPRYWLHGLLLVVTMFTMLVVGAQMQYNFLRGIPSFSFDERTLPVYNSNWGDLRVMFETLFPITWIAQDPLRILMGVPFALTLMLILLAHEMGHYLYCRHYDVDATLPYFIPAPTLIGTLGAFIRIKSPIRSRSALFDIGIAGPIAGFVIAVAVLFLSLPLSKPLVPNTPGADILGYPLIFYLVHWLLTSIGLSGAGRVPLDQVYLHPTAIAAWVGMFATALNLLPGGQLDGGHIVFALFPRLQKHVSLFTIGVLLPMGVYLWQGWWIWAFLLALTGLQHPRVPAWPGVDRNRKLVALIGLALLILTFVPMPFNGAALR